MNEFAFRGLVWAHKSVSLVLADRGDLEGSVAHEREVLRRRLIGARSSPSASGLVPLGPLTTYYRSRERGTRPVTDDGQVRCGPPSRFGALGLGRVRVGRGKRVDHGLRRFKDERGF